MRAAMELRKTNSGGPDARSALWGSKCVGARLVATSHAAAAMHLAMSAHARAQSPHATDGDTGGIRPGGCLATVRLPGTEGAP